MSLPPLQSITALETLDRLGSVKATASALNLTQSAVSHKLKTLQVTLGFPVMVANGRGVILTSQARQYVRSIRPALAALQDAHQTISTASGPLTISCAPGFAAYWLAPRLSEFRHLFPDIALRLLTQDNASADLSIRLCFYWFASVSDSRCANIYTPSCIRSGRRPRVWFLLLRMPVSWGSRCVG